VEAARRILALRVESADRLTVGTFGDTSGRVVTGVRRVGERRTVFEAGRLILPWLVFVGATQAWRPWGDGIRLQYAADEQEYETIARAAPGFPHVKIQTPHADRFVPHWLVGEAANLTTLPLHVVYAVAMGLTLAATLAVLCATVLRLGIGAAAGGLCIGAVVASAYPLRYLLDSPGMLTDALFVLGLVLTVHGFVTGRFRWTLLGLAVATLGRQTGVPLAVVALVAAWFQPAWRARRLVHVTVGAAVATAVYLVPHMASASWADTSGRGVIGMTLLGGSWTDRQFLAHVGRCLIVVVVPAGLLVLGWARSRVRPSPVPLLLGVIVWLQAIALAPDWSHSEPRLAGLALPAIVLAAAPALDAAALTPAETALAAIGIGLASLHYLYTDVGIHSAAQWAALVVAGAVLVLMPLLPLRVAREAAGAARARKDLERHVP
jgi:hypothetical protein